MPPYTLQHPSRQLEKPDSDSFEAITSRDGRSVQWGSDVASTAAGRAYIRRKWRPNAVIYCVSGYCQDTPVLELAFLV